MLYSLRRNGDARGLAGADDLRLLVGCLLDLASGQAGLGLSSHGLQEGLGACAQDGEQGEAAVVLGPDEEEEVSGQDPLPCAHVGLGDGAEGAPRKVHQPKEGELDAEPQDLSFRINPGLKISNQS